ncbi:MAG: hypothetical protein QM778_35355 [Myxococcales bacterium]
MRRTCITLSLVALGACQHGGGGQGTLESAATADGTKAEGPVTFLWHSGVDPTQGNIEATLPNGTEFNGTFLQATATVNADAYGPYYNAWGDPAWGNPWYSGPADGFVTEYSGQVLAHLTAASGTRMRCKFSLRDPVSGMTGGGAGDCQLSDNQTIFDAQLTKGK